MAMDLYLNFGGNCREAVAFYAEVFGQPMPQMMAYGDMPPAPGHTMPDEVKNLVMNTALDIHGTKVMFSDTPPGMPFIIGNNVSLVVESTNMDEIKALYEKLSHNGSVSMELQQTFWSPCYGMVTYQFGILWQLSYNDGRNG